MSNLNIIQKEADQFNLSYLTKLKSVQNNVTSNIIQK